MKKTKKLLSLAIKNCGYNCNDISNLKEHITKLASLGLIKNEEKMKLESFFSNHAS